MGIVRLTGGGDSEWIEESFTNVASYDLLAVPTEGTDLEIYIQVHGTGAVGGVWLELYWNGDYTATNYRNQITAGESGGASASQQNNASICTISGTTSAANPNNPSSCWVVIPQFRSSLRKRLKSEWNEIQRSSSSHILIGATTVFRETAGSGALSDAITAVRLVCPSTNITGLVRYRWVM